MALDDHTYCKLPLILSVYAEKLDNVSKERYIKKLTVMQPDGSIFYLPDPYLMKKTDWRNDLSAWPNITVAKINSYLTKCPGLNKKSLDAYDFVVSGKVQDVLIYVPEIFPSLKMLSTLVMPSMKCNNKPYQPWVITENDDIKAAHCTCIGGLGEVCSHVSALLYKIQFAIVAGVTSACTEKKCEWNSSFTKTVKAAPMKDIDLSKANIKMKQRKLSVIPPRVVSPIKKDQFRRLKSIIPDAAFFTVYSSNSDDESQTESDEENAGEEFFPSMISILEKQVISCNADLLAAFQGTDFSRIEILTRGQNNSLWKDQRIGRLTSSNFGHIFRKKKRDEKFAATFLTASKELQAPAVIWGKEKEKMALEAYFAEIESDHSSFKMEEAGLFISHSDPYLATSPDAIVLCDCCGKGVVEVKCPYKFRELNPAAIPSEDSSFYLDSNGTLKKSHLYFAQIQGQMAITDVDYCDFVVWTTKGILITRISRDDLYWETNKVILQKFFFEQVVPFFYNSSNF